MRGARRGTGRTRKFEGKACSQAEKEGCRGGMTRTVQVEQRGMWRCLNPWRERQQYRRVTQGETETERCKEGETETGKVERETKRKRTESGRRKNWRGGAARTFCKLFPRRSLIWPSHPHSCGVCGAVPRPEGAEAGMWEQCPTPAYLFPLPPAASPRQGPKFRVQGVGQTLEDLDGAPRGSPTRSCPLPSAPLTSAHASLNLWPSPPCLPTLTPSCPPLCPPLHSSRDHLSARLRVWG